MCSSDLTFKHMERRSSAVAKMKYNQDGTIKEVPYWTENVVEQIEPFNPFRRVEAETMHWGYGLKTEKMPDGKIALINIDNNESLSLKGVDFKEGAKQFIVSAACVMPGSYLELRLDSTDGPLIGTVKINPTGSMHKYEEMSTKISGAKGVHDLYLCFKSNSTKDNLYNLDYWEFK